MSIKLTPKTRAFAKAMGAGPAPQPTLATVKDAMRQMRVQVITLIGNGEYLLAMLDQLTADIRKIENAPPEES